MAASSSSTVFSDFPDAKDTKAAFESARPSFPFATRAFCRLCHYTQVAALEGCCIDPQQLASARHIGCSEAHAHASALANAHTHVSACFNNVNAARAGGLQYYHCQPAEGLPPTPREDQRSDDAGRHHWEHCQPAAEYLPTTLRKASSALVI
eukprot:jgi/Chlat1/1038/Chrsp109S01453